MKAHRTDGVSLVFALIFLALAGWWLLAQILDLALPAVGWFLAGALILIGVLGLFGALRSGRSTPPTAAPTGAGTAATSGGTATGAEPTTVGEPTTTTSVLEPVTEPGQDESGSTSGDLGGEAPTAPPGRPGES